MEQKFLHNRKTASSHPCIAPTFKVQFFHGFDKYGSSLMNIVVLGKVQLSVQYLTSECSSQLQRTGSNTLRVQVKTDKRPVLWKRHTDFSQ